MTVDNLTCKCGSRTEVDSVPRVYQRGGGRFPFFISCRCGRQTNATATRGAAVALWKRGELLLGPASEASS